MTQSRKSPSEKVVYMVADHTSTDPLDLPPLYETIDPDALDRLLEDESSTTQSIEFRYADHLVRIAQDGTVDVTETSANSAQYLSESAKIGSEASETTRLGTDD
jgi:hypothetical protein